MANTSRLLGFVPVKHLTGAPYNGQANIYEIAAADTSPVMRGDLVMLSDLDATDVYPAVERIAASGQVTSVAIVGSVVGFVVVTGTSGRTPNLDVPIYRAASTKQFVLVADSPDLLFEVQDGGTVPCTLALLGSNTGITATAGSTTSGLSNMATGTTAPTTTSTLPLQILGVYPRVDNESAAASQKLLVRINTHAFHGSIAGV